MEQHVSKPRSSTVIIGVIAAIIIGFGIVAGIALSLRASTALGYDPAVWKATKTGPDTATLNFSTFPDSHVCHASEGEPQLDWVTYCPSTSFEVPPNSLITVVINQYDSASGLINDYFQHVHGTVGGVMTVNDKPMTQIDADQPAHTFTIQSTPDSTQPMFISVPLLGVADDAPNVVNITGDDGSVNSYPKPNVISFQFRTGAPETYIWHCYVPCGEDRVPPFGFTGAMSTTGFMAGTVTVANY